MKMRYSYTNVDYDIAKFKNDYYLKIAAEVARKSPMMHKHGCIIVHKKRIIASGYNTMPDMFNNSLHAEVNALNKIKNKPTILKESDMYIVRIGTDSYNNVLKYSKPCEHCTKRIIESKVRKVYYSTNYEYDTFVHIKNYQKSLLCQTCI